MENKKGNDPDTHIEIVVNGPLVVTGNFVFADLKRGITITESEVKICRCTRSSNKPFCDSSCKRQSWI